MNLNLPPAPGSVNRSEVIGLGVVTLIGLIIRILVWKYQAVVSIDGAWHLQMVGHYGGGVLEDSGRPYGYSLLCMLVSWITQDRFVAAKVVSLLFGTAIIPLTWWVGRSWLRSPVLALLPAAAMAILPITVRYSLTSMPGAMATALMLLMAGLVLSRRALAAGIAGGAVFLVRPDLILVPALTALVLYGAKFVSARRFTIGVVVTAAAVCLVHFAHRGDLNLVVHETQWTQSLDFSKDAEDIMELPRPLDTLRTAARHSGYVVLLAALVGVFSGGALLAAAWIGAFAATLLKPSSGAHFVLPMIPLIWILAAAAAGAMRTSVLRGSVTAILIAGLAWTSLQQNIGYTLNEDGYQSELLDAGMWLRERTPEGKVLYSTSPLPAYYARASHRPFPEGEDYSEVVGQIVVSGGDYVVAHELSDPEDSAMGILVRDKVVALFDPRVRPLNVNNDYLDGRTSIYRVARPGGPGEFSEETQMRKYIAKMPHGPDHELHAILALASGDAWVAANEYLSAIRAYPDDERLSHWYYERANCLGSIGKENELRMADAAIRSALDIEPDNPKFLELLVRILRAQGRDRAADYWEGKLEGGTD